MACTLQRLLLDIVAVGADVEWLPSGAGVPTIVIGEVALSGLSGRCGASIRGAGGAGASSSNATAPRTRPAATPWLALGQRTPPDGP